MVFQTSYRLYSSLLYFCSSHEILAAIKGWGDDAYFSESKHINCYVIFRPWRLACG